MSLFLGLDSSTQGVKALVIDTVSGDIAAEAAVNFGKDLPHYQSPAGYIPNDNPLIRQADPLMWLDGLDLVLQRLVATGVDMAAIRGVSGAGQQHGTVYLNASAKHCLANLTPDAPLSTQLRSALARPVAPIWLDRSTSDECAELYAAFGDRLQRDTGSPASERFPAPQVRRFHKLEPAAYDDTAIIHLVSSFLCSVLIGADAPIDYADGAGMNLLNLHTMLCDDAIAEFAAPGLLKKLPAVANPASIAGFLSPYFARYGLTPKIPVAPWTGDNPSSLIGTGAGLPGYAGISLGTSDTFFGKMNTFKTDPEGCGHVFGHPAGGFMSLICFSNGSLARERVKNECDASWEFFDVEACKLTPPGNDGCLLLPYFEPESTPLRLTPGPKPNFDWAAAAPERKIRAILESQALSMRLHTLWLDEPIRAIRLTGGASKSPSFQQIIADVFQAPVQIAGSTNACALGAAMRAANACGDIDWNALNDMFCKPVQTIQPNPQTADVYAAALDAYKALERA